MKSLIVLITLLCVVSCNSKQSARNTDIICTCNKVCDNNTDSLHSKPELSFKEMFFGKEDAEFDYIYELNISLPEFVLLVNKTDYKEMSNIKGYIEDIMAEGVFLSFIRNDDNSEIKEMVIPIKNFVDKIQIFKDGKSTYYPYKELHEILKYMLHEIAYCENHGGYIIPRELLIFPRLLELAVQMSPNMESIATKCSDDGRLGVITINSGYNELFDFSALISKVDGTYNVKYLPYSYCHIDRIEKTGETQYLLTTEKSTYTVNIMSNGYLEIENNI